MKMSDSDPKKKKRDKNQAEGKEMKFRAEIKKDLQNCRERRRTMGRGSVSYGRCRPQTLQRFLSLGFNSMLPVCHSDPRSVPVIRTAFRAGPKQHSCFSRGKEGWRVGVRGAYEPMRCTFKIDTGALHFHILAHSVPADWWEMGGSSCVFLDYY